MNRQQIYKRLDAHYEAAVNKYNERAVLGVFLFGSQNYGTDTETSDVDTKCILVPDLYTLALHPYETKHLSVDGEVCECMTIQHMVANWKKQNINFVEILFTPYFKINPFYEDIWDDFCIRWREEVARYDIKKAILSMGNQALHTIKQDPSDFKKQMNTLRIRNSLVHLVQNSVIGYWHIIHFDSKTRAELRLVREQGASSEQIEGAIADLKYMIDNADKYATNLQTVNRYRVDAACESLVMQLISRNIGLGDY